MENTTPTPNKSQETLECVQCGYLLRGLEGIARCPECGLEIDSSLSRWELRRSDPFWVADLLKGATLGVAAVAGVLVVAIVRIARTLTPLMWSPITYLDGAVVVCGWMSAMLVSGDEKDPIPLHEQINIPRALRIAATVHLITQFVYFGSTPWPTAMNWAIFWCRSVAGLAAITFYYLQIRRLGKRIPDAFIIRHSTLVMAASVAGQVIVHWVPSLINIFRGTGSNFEAAPGQILTWAASAYALALLLRLRKRLLGAGAEARQNWAARQTSGC